jgi:hypothetical protein
MSEQQNYGFGKFVPGFDFLQNLSKGSSQNQAAMPNLSNWVAPTLNLEELDKRIGELRAVHFWLEQNSKALGATIQALELQKMTLATLKGMNFNMAEVADAFRLQTEPAAAGGTVAGKSAKPASVAGAAADAVARVRAGKKGKSAGQAAAGVADPLQWWSALTEQFQTIAARALDEAARSPAIEAAREMAKAGSSAATSGAGSSAAAKGGAVERPTPEAPVKHGAAVKKASAPRRPAAKKTSRKRVAR